MSTKRSVCLGYPALLAEPYVERVRAIDPALAPVGLPVDPGNAEWIRISPADPHDEPPDWARSVADPRRAALADAEVLIALHVPRDLMALAPRLRWIQGVGAGVEQFAAAGVRRDRVVMTNASGLSAGSISCKLLNFSASGPFGTVGDPGALIHTRGRSYIKCEGPRREMSHYS